MDGLTFSCCGGGSGGTGMQILVLSLFSDVRFLARGLDLECIEVALLVDFDDIE